MASTAIGWPKDFLSEKTRDPLAKILFWNSLVIKEEFDSTQFRGKQKMLFWPLLITENKKLYLRNW